MDTPDVVCGVSAINLTAMADGHNKDHQLAVLLSNSPLRAVSAAADQPAPRNCSQQPRGVTNGRGGLLQASTP